MPTMYQASAIEDGESTVALHLLRIATGTFDSTNEAVELFLSVEDNVVTQRGEPATSCASFSSSTAPVWHPSVEGALNALLEERLTTTLRYIGALPLGEISARIGDDAAVASWAALLNFWVAADLPVE